MNKKHYCHREDRNYYLPSGLKACGFIDFDGTIAKCEPLFLQAKREFACFMELFGFNKAEVLEILEEHDNDNVSKHGFELHRLGDSMKNVYRQLLSDRPEATNEDYLGICENIGFRPFFKSPEPFPNAIRVLNRIRKRYHLTLVTIGDYGAQKFKASEIGSSIFDEVIITSQDDKAEYVKLAMEAYDADPLHCFMLGNSKKSDGAVAQHTNFIWLPLENGWKRDDTELPKNTGFKITEAKSWREVEEKAIKPMVWARKYKLGDNGSYPDTSLDTGLDSDSTDE